MPDGLKARSLPSVGEPRSVDPSVMLRLRGLYLPLVFRDLEATVIRDVLTSAPRPSDSVPRAPLQAR